MSSVILETQNLKKYFEMNTSIIDSLLSRDRDQIMAVDDVSIKLHGGEIKGVIGESGCGKSTLLECLIGLHRPTAGKILFKGQDLSAFTKNEWKEYRRNVQIIFQDPFNAINPKMTVREALGEAIKIHDLDKDEADIKETLSNVGLTPAESYLDNVPHELSGGQKQRVAIARALILEPNVLLADEPVSMLDVSTQASILKLLQNLRDQFNMSILYISHDISSVARICDRISTMYLGRRVEAGPTPAIINEPKHPYTQALVNAIPISDPSYHRTRTELEGNPSDPINIGEGCRFRDRCPERMEMCGNTPLFVEVDDDHFASCHLYYDHDERVNASGRDKDEVTQ